jgi:dienelactone hydrolase
MDRIVIPALFVASLLLQQPSFDYNRALPPDIKETARRQQDGADLRDITYATLDGRRNSATIVDTAKVSGGRGAVLFVHWYGPPRPTSNRTQFIPDAVALAKAGVVSLLIDTPWSLPEYFKLRKREEDYARSVQQVKDLRRALDVLLSLPNIDPARVAVVGHDFGAMYGALAVAGDRRVTAFVFMAGAPSFSDWFLYGPPLLPEARQRFIDELAPLDPVRYLPKIQAPVLLQFANQDEHVAKARADLVIASAREPKTARFYDAGHELSAEATRDRLVWVGERLAKPAATSR